MDTSGVVHTVRLESVCFCFPSWQNHGEVSVILYIGLYSKGDFHLITRVVLYRRRAPEYPLRYGIGLIPIYISFVALSLKQLM